MIIESVAKHGDKNSAIKLNFNYICQLPLPRERIDLNIVSPFSSAGTTPVKSPQSVTQPTQPTQPTARAAKVTKRNFD
jgi:hypothetical protein